MYESIDERNRKSFYFSVDKLEKTEEIEDQDLFLLFLPDFSMYTPIHFLLENVSIPL
jgi:hypothetical protein